MSEKSRTELEETVRCLRNLLPYLKDWEAWQREIRRLERNEIKLRKHRFVKLAKTLDESLSRFKSVLQEERTVHAFTVNQLVAKLDGRKKHDRGN